MGVRSWRFVGHGSTKLQSSLKTIFMIFLNTYSFLRNPFFNLNYKLFSGDFVFVRMLSLCLPQNDLYLSELVFEQGANKCVYVSNLKSEINNSSNTDWLNIDNITYILMFWLITIKLSGPVYWLI